MISDEYSDIVFLEIICHTGTETQGNEKEKPVAYYEQ